MSMEPAPYDALARYSEAVESRTKHRRVAAEWRAIAREEKDAQRQKALFALATWMDGYAEADDIAVKTFASLVR